MVVAGWFVYPIALNAGSTIAQGKLHPGDVTRAYLFQVIATTTNACLGIMALLILTTSPWLAFALVPPGILVLAGQIAAGESQRRADRNEFLYRTTEILHSTRQMGERAGELLNGITEMFGIARAELVVIPEVRGPAVRFISIGDDDHAVVSTSELTFAEQEVLNEFRTRRDAHRSARQRTSRSASHLPSATRTQARSSCCAAVKAPRACSCSSTRRAVATGWGRQSRAS